MSGFRREKLASLIRQTLGELINREYQSLADNLFSVSYIRVAADMSWANVYCTCIGSKEELSQHLDFLQQHTGHLRYMISQQLHLKKTPSLRFYADIVSERSRRIEQLLYKKA